MKNKSRSFLFALAIIAPMFLFSQPSPNSGGPGGGTSGLPAGGQNYSLPIDGGVGLVIIMAIGLGIKRQLFTSNKDE
jgi:hypothetical protein